MFFSEDTLEHGFHDVIMTKNKEFVCLTRRTDMDTYTSVNRLLHINNKGKILKDVFFSKSSSNASVVETDSNYFVILKYQDYLFKFSKDSLNVYDSVRIAEEHGAESAEGTMITVGNQLIYSNLSMEYHECGEELPRLEMDRSMVFLNEDLSMGNRLVVGKSCANDRDEHKNMHYINPDSIYYVYTTDKYRWGSTISISNFSWNGQLNFDNHLDIMEDSMTMKIILNCKAVSNGGVLICGVNSKDIGINTNSVGFLLLYHPTKVGIKEYTPDGVERRVFPNPAQTHFTVTNTENASLQLYNMLGQEVFSTYSREENTTINVNTLPQGLYVLKVIQNGVGSTHKIVISD